MSSLACCCSRACLAGVARSLSVVYLPGLLVSVWLLLFLWEGAVDGGGGASVGNTVPGGIMGGMPGGRIPVSSVWVGGRLLRADTLGLLLRPSLTIVS